MKIDVFYMKNITLSDFGALLKPVDLGKCIQLKFLVTIMVSRIPETKKNIT